MREGAKKEGREREGEGEGGREREIGVRERGRQGAREIETNIKSKIFSLYSHPF